MPKGSPFDRRYNLVMYDDLWQMSLVAAARDGITVAEWWRRAAAAACKAAGIKPPKKTRRKRAA